jgi:hypothetical protein
MTAKKPLFNPEQDVSNSEEDPDRFTAAWGRDDPDQGDIMAITDTIKESLQRIPADLQKTAQSAFADVANTYQAFLVRDSSFDMSHQSADLSHEIAMQTERESVEVEVKVEVEALQPTQEIEPER